MQPLSPDELEALRRNDARYRAVLLASAAIVWIASPDGEFVERQPIWEEYTGQSWEEYRGSRWTSVIHPDDRARVMQDWMGAVATQGPVYRTQGRIWSSKHAAWRSFQTRGVPVRDASGNIVEWVGALTDVQDTVDAIDQGRLQAERASKEKTRFLAATSHDLRQPLQSLAALIHLLAARSRDPVDAPLLSRAERAVRSMTDLLNALLDLSQLDAGVSKPKIEAFPVARLLDAMRAEFELAALDKGLTLAVPPAADWIRSDPALLARLVRNLLSNAVKYTPAGGQVSLICSRDGTNLALEVKDTGIGIPRDQHVAIFDEFVQLDNPERDRRKGLGLGLSIVAKTAALLNHRLTVESSPGVGSTFGVLVPLAPPRTDEEETPGTAAAAGMKILLVDDNPEVLDSLTDMMASWGHRVVSAANAEEALRIIRSDSGPPFDATVCDYRLPSLSGLDVIGEFRKRWASAIRILLSGDTYQTNLDSVSKMGVRLLTKPVTAAALAKALDPSVQPK